MVKRSFGKPTRRPGDQPRRAPSRNVETPDVYDIAQQSNGASQTVLYSISGVAVVAAVIIGAAIYGAMSGSDGSAVAARGTPQGVALMGVISFDMLRPDDRNTLSERDVHINSSCLKRGWLQLSNSHRVMRVGDPEGKIPPRAGMSAGAASRFLACSMRVQQQRFCQTFYRERLAHRLRDYVSVEIFRRQHLKALMRHPSSRFGMEMTQQMHEDIHKSRGRRRPTGVRSGIRPIVSKRLGAAITQLSQLGYLSARDFGYWSSSVPDALRPYLQSTAMKPKCG